MQISKGKEIIAGVDEVGRGAVAGPVVAGACVLKVPLYRRRRTFPCWSPFERKRKQEIAIADSKMLTPEERECAYEWLSRTCAFGIGISPVEVVESRGILAATNEAMLMAIEQLRSKIEVHELLVDGRDHFHFPLPHRSIIRGDSTEPCIAAASIVAKVTRDRMMRDYAPSFPQYGFDRHKGYGTREHLLTITRYGTCVLHRKSFLRAVLENQPLPF